MSSERSYQPVSLVHTRIVRVLGVFDVAAVEFDVPYFRARWRAILDAFRESNIDIIGEMQVVQQVCLIDFSAKMSTGRIMCSLDPQRLSRHLAMSESDGSDRMI
mmetsp:Transcript_2172/g.5015  ORF Transcript_2172/g.5015 Transcript_2172/m.5015 type:complete len:104 (+) Transcript_2172:566-877(+)